MNFSILFNLLTQNFLFSFCIILISFTLGYCLYDLVIVRGIKLKDALFEKDNLAAWIEFIGAFIYPVLFLAAKAIQGSASSNIWMDLLICSGYAVLYIVLFTVLRLFSSLFVSLFAGKDESGRIRLNEEIYTQKNISASLFSIALAVVFANLVRFIDVNPSFLAESAFNASSIIVMTLGAIAVYLVIQSRRAILFKEIFVDNNIAAGAEFLGFMFSVQLLLANVMLLHPDYSFLELIGVSFISLSILGLLASLFTIIFGKLIKVEFWREIYEQNNVGAAIGQSALYIGIANVIIHFMK